MYPTLEASFLSFHKLDSVDIPWSKCHACLTAIARFTVINHMFELVRIQERSASTINSANLQFRFQQLDYQNKSTEILRYLRIAMLFALFIPYDVRMCLHHAPSLDVVFRVEQHRLLASRAPGHASLQTIHLGLESLDGCVALFEVFIQTISLGDQLLFP